MEEKEAYIKPINKRKQHQKQEDPSIHTIKRKKEDTGVKRKRKKRYVHITAISKRKDIAKNSKKT